MFGFAPSVDGAVLLQQPFSLGFSDISKNISLMTGTTLNELTRTAYSEKDLTMAEAKARLMESYGEKTDDFVKLYEEAYPEYTAQDLLSIDTVFRPNTIKTADEWSSASNAPVYTYLLTWKSPVENASKGSFHGLDIPLAFNNVDLREDWTGNTEEAWNLSEKMSSAWLNFAKTGNPNVKLKLPRWQAYTKENGTTMIFDVDCRIVSNHDREFLVLISIKNNL